MQDKMYLLFFISFLLILYGLSKDITSPLITTYHKPFGAENTHLYRRKPVDFGFVQ